MAVYTEVTKPQLRDFLAQYGAIGGDFTAEGLADGVDNTNYLITTADGRHVLTIFERRVEAELPFFLSLVEYLGKRGFRCPLPLRDRRGRQLGRLADKPACLVHFLTGAPPKTVTVGNCLAVGEALAELHLLAKGFAPSRKNDLGTAHFVNLYERYLASGGEPVVGLKAQIDEVAARVAELNLPTGIIHGDLFPDNVFFKAGRLNGVIDFYFASTDILAYDLAIAINAWSFGKRGKAMAFDRAKAEAIVGGYRRGGGLGDNELAAMGLLLKAAALCFWLTRLVDAVRPRRGIVHCKDPQDFAKIFAFHKNGGWTPNR